MDRPATETYTW